MASLDSFEALEPTKAFETHYGTPLELTIKSSVKKFDFARFSEDRTCGRNCEWIGNDLIGMWKETCRRKWKVTGKQLEGH